MKTLISFARLKLLFTTLVSMAILLGCSGRSNSPALSKTSTPTPSGSRSETGESPVQSPGTGAPGGGTDGGGGNGIANKPIESYIIDPRSLPAFKNKLFPKFEAMRKSSAGDQNFSMDLMFLFKTWYLIPLELKPVDASKIGLGITKENSQQLALQTVEEVWIDSNLFNKMSEDDQAKLLLHELLMSIYTMSTIPPKNLCHRLPKELVGEDCLSSITNVTRFDESRLPHALVAEDYTHIRIATEKLFASKEWNEDEFSLILYQNNFGRFWGSNLGTERVAEQKIVTFADKDALKLFKYSKLMNSLPRHCFIMRTQEFKECNLAVSQLAELAINQENSDAVRSRSLKTEEVESLVADKLYVQHFQLSLPNASPMDLPWVLPVSGESPLQDVSPDFSSFLKLTSWHIFYQIVGDTHYKVELYLSERKDSGEWDLRAIVMTPYRILEENRKVGVCNLRKLTGLNNTPEPIILTDSKDLALDIEGEYYAPNDIADITCLRISN